MNPSKSICVLVMSGPLKGHKFFVKSNSPILIGRGTEANIKIAYDALCSRKHAVVYYEQDSCYLIDLKSTNGTFLNGERISEKIKVKNKDVISLGDTKLMVLINNSKS